ncbi:MAG: hypothetical protein JWP45_1933 [Mucilaginibacter sp.]|nr:hypothetical protein [Mucilaginibacter sp.]
MEIITVRTTQNIDIDYEIGGLGERILAYMIDLGIFVALSIIGGILSVSLFNNGGGISVYFIVIGVVLLFYDLVCESLFNGQSLGKRIMKIRVISLDGTRPKFSQYLLRWLFRIIDFSLTSYLGGLLTIILTDNGQRIGDLVAGTAIIRTIPRSTMNNIIFHNVDDNYQPVFIQSTQLSDQDIALIHEVINNYLKTGNSVLVYNMADKIREHLSVSLPPNMNSMLFLQTIVKDYSHLTAQADAL